MSRGAGAALAVAAQSPEIQCVACEGAFLNEELFLDHAIRWGERFLPRLFIQLVPTSEVIRAFRIMIWFSQHRQGCHYVNLKSYLKSLRKQDLLFLVGRKRPECRPEDDRNHGSKKFDLQKSKFAYCRRPFITRAALTQPDQFDAALIDFFSQMPLKFPQQTETEFRSDPVFPFRKRSA